MSSQDHPESLISGHDAPVQDLLARIKQVTMEAMKSGRIMSDNVKVSVHGS